MKGHSSLAFSRTSYIVENSVSWFSYGRLLDGKSQSQIPYLARPVDPEKGTMVHRTKAPSTLILEQFKRQAFYSLYVEGRTLVEFTAMMDKLFKKIRDDTQVELQVG